MSAENEFVSHPAAIQRALEYLKSHDFTKMKDGRYEIEGDKLYVNVERYETTSTETIYPEVHRRYIDLQYVVEGEEFLGWCPLSPDLKVHTPYDAEKDIEFFEELMPDSNFPLAAGGFAILSPKDVHRSHISIEGNTSHVTKVVAKISVDLLKK